ncbi:MAG: T9SS type A sorting domain-containing protein [Bacteroidales bacterium]|nr:T9SS type A sorting domain-containing protein [Bacteroidales bacterium]
MVNFSNDVRNLFEMKRKTLILLLTLLICSSPFLNGQTEPYAILSRGSLGDLTERNLDGSLFYVKLHGEQFSDATLFAGNFSLTTSIQNLSVSEVFYRGADTCICRLVYPEGADFDEIQSISLTIDASELVGSQDVSSANTLPVTPLIEPVITNVTIADHPYKIGDQVYCTITVETDSEEDYTYDGGTVAGRSLQGFTRTGTVVYQAYVTVEEGGPAYAAGEDIPVSNLRLFNPDGFVYGEFYNALISQPNDVIDSDRPVVNSAVVNGGTYRVGQTLSLAVTADQSDYVFDPVLTTTNGIPLTESRVYEGIVSGNQYYLNYTVAEGDDDLLSGPLPVEIVMIDPVGNANINPFTAVSGINPLIDANSPQLLSAEIVDPDVCIIGDTVQMLLDFSEGGISARSGTHVNQIPLGTQVKFQPVSGTRYSLIYIVYEGDQQVNPGELTYNVVVQDPLGNESSSAITPLNNTVSVYATRPTAVISGEGEICRGSSHKISATFTGDGPWDVTIEGDQGFNQSFFNITSPFTLFVKPTVTETYAVTGLFDKHGNSGTGYGSVVVKVNLPTPVTILNTQLVYLRDAEPVQLLGDPEGGVFSGEGVESSTGIFYPGLVDTSTNQTTIMYLYVNEYGCSSSATKQFTVIDQGYAISGLPGVVCENDDPFEVSAFNESGNPGIFRLLKDGTDVSSSGLADPDPGDDTVIIIPGALERGFYDLEYSFEFNEERYSYLTPFFLDRVAHFAVLSPDSVCANAGPIELIVTPNSDFNTINTHVYTGQGVSGNLSTGYFFDPEEADSGTNMINYQITSSEGCVKDTSFMIVKLDVPLPDFDVSTVCIPSEGGEVSMINLTNKQELVKEWLWNFGDINSGTQNTSTLFEPVHRYTASGNRTIQLRIGTTEGCMAILQKTIEFADKPVSDFTWVSDCYSETRGIEFVNKSSSDSPWLRHIWTIFENSGKPVNTITLSGPTNMVYQFSKVDDYRVRLVCENVKGCTDTLERLVALKPTLILNTDNSYYETFDQSNGRWDSRADSLSISSWTYGEPDFDGFESMPGNFAWFTDLPEIKTAESSWVQSPCFDMTGMEKPLIRLDIMKSFNARYDGAVLQYTLDNGKTWQNVGSVDDGIQWYNASDIISAPGGSSTGWSGTTTFNPDTRWIQGSHDLNDLINRKNAVFRIAYASDGSPGEDNHGFAFDNFFIGERTRMTVLEYFTNSSSSASLSADRIADQFITGIDSLDVITLQYHTAYPGEDPMNLNNPYPASGRSFYYGITEVPFAVLNGGTRQDLQFDFEAEIPQSMDVRMIALELPKFDIQIEVTLNDGNMDMNIRLTALDDYPEDELLLHTVIAERLVTGYKGNNGDDEFRNVVLEMLPDPAGKLIQKEWYQGESYIQPYSWTMEHYEDQEELIVISFLQERQTGEILQAAKWDVFSATGVTTRDWNVRELSIFPNPVSDILFVLTGERNSQDPLLTILDLTGRRIMISQPGPGNSPVELPVNNLQKGIYLLNYSENGLLKGRCKFIKIE